MSKSFEIVDDVIEALNDRKGFRQFWDDLDEDIQEEIREELAEIVEGHDA
jgi:hypothetical protein